MLRSTTFKRVTSTSLLLLLTGSIILGLSGSASAAGAEAGRWNFNELVSGAASDSVGTNTGNPFGRDNNPQLSTDVPYISPTNNGSAQFDGSNYFEINNPLSDDMSICAWIKTSSTGEGYHYQSAPIIDSEIPGFALDYAFGIQFDGKLMFGNGGIIDGNSIDNQVYGSTVVADNKWHNVCVTRNNTSGAVVLYADGVEDGSGILGVGSLTSNSRARIGSGFDGNLPFIGLIDDLRLFNSVLGASEILAIAANDEETVDLVPEENESTPKGADENLADTGVNTSYLITFASLLIVSGFATRRLRRR